MLWIILTVLITILVLRFGRRYSRFPTHIIGVEGYEWADDFLNWIFLHYDWTGLYVLVINSVQEQFRRRAPPGWTFKFEGCPSFPTSSQLGRRSCLSIGSLPHVEALPVGSEAAGNRISPAIKREETPKLKPETDPWSWESTNAQATAGVTKNVKCLSDGYAFTIDRIQTLQRSPNEVALVIDVRLTGWSHEVFVTCRHANQLESTRLPLNLTKLTGQAKFSIADVANEKRVNLSVCFVGVPSINISIPGTHFQKEETRATLERILKESISNVGVKVPLFTTTSQEKYAADSEQQIISHSSNLKGAPTKEPQVIGRPNNLIIKVLKANALYDKGNYEIQCLVTVDSPLQSQKTSSVADSPNPFFDELLTFRLDDTTRKVSFVVQDKNETSVPLGRAELLLRDLAIDGAKSTRVVLPLMGQRPTSNMSLTVDVSSGRSETSLRSEARSREEHSNDVRPNQASTLKPSINVEHLLLFSGQSSDQSLHSAPPSGRSPLGKSPSHTDSNLSLASQASLLARNSSRESSGRPKQKSLIDAMKQRFRGKGKRSRSAEPTSKGGPDVSPNADKVFSDGIYLTPPPRRLPAPGQTEHWSLSSSQVLTPDTQTKKRGKMSSFKSLFRKKGQSLSPKQLHPQAVQQ